jgi:hypothetical protein
LVENKKSNIFVFVFGQEFNIRPTLAHTVVVHVVGTENLVFVCLKCGVECYPLSAGVEEVLRRCSLHDQSCTGNFVSLGPGRKVKLDEWVMYLESLTTMAKL